MNWPTAIAPLVVSGALAVAAPPRWRTVRAAAVVYALGTVATACVCSPVGTNVERLVGIAGLPLLAAALRERAADWGRLRWARWGVFRSGRTRLVWVLIPLLTVSLNYSGCWLLTKTVSDLRVSTTVPAWASHTQGVIGVLDRLDADRHRVEVVPARDHREAAALAAHVNMARGWNRQLDVERDRLFYEQELPASSYRAWLDEWAVAYVVLPHGRIDGPAKKEAALIADGPAWLEPVWQDPYWTIYRVADAVPLASAPATVVRAGEADVVVHLPAAGSTVLRVVYSPWFVASGACVRPAGNWTRITATAGGDYRIHTSYRALGRGCG